MPRGRTRLTVPPGEEPLSPDQGAQPHIERYSPGLAVPTEPRIVSRGVKRSAVIAVLLIIAGAGYAGVTLAGRGQDEDPALTRTPAPGASQLPGEEVPEGASPGGRGNGPSGEPTGGLTPVTPTPST